MYKERKIWKQMFVKYADYLTTYKPIGWPDKIEGGEPKNSDKIAQASQSPVIPCAYKVKEIYESQNW